MAGEGDGFGFHWLTIAWVSNRNETRGWFHFAESQIMVNKESHPIHMDE